MDNTESSGGTRFSEGKPGMWWAIPLMGLRLIAEVTQHGSKKYAPLDWACGQSYSTLIDSFTRHWIEVLTRGVQSRDEESGKLHLAHAGWNILCLLHFVAQGRDDLDDTHLKWEGVTTAMKNDIEEPEVAYQITEKGRKYGVGIGDIGDVAGALLDEAALHAYRAPTWHQREEEVAVSKSPGAERVRKHASLTKPDQPANRRGAGWSPEVEGTQP